jgi:PAS domain S-box-containing protein
MKHQLSQSTEAEKACGLLEARPAGFNSQPPQPEQADPSLAESAHLLEMLLENSPDAIYFKDLQSRFVRYSRVFSERYLPGHLTRLEGKTDFDIFTAEHARPAFEDEQAIIRTGRPMIGKLEKETFPNGQVAWALTSKMPWRDKQGRIVGTFGISKDVTPLKKTEDKLAEQQELLRTLLDNVPDCIYFKDRQSRFVHVNRSKLLKSVRRVPHLQKQVEETGGEADTQLLAGLTDFDIFAEAHARPAFDDEQRIIATGEPLIDKLERQTHLDGAISWSLTTKMPWRDKEGQILGTFGVSRDISALKEAEAELAAANQRLLETSRLAGMAEVASDVLHNVGNTLNSINVSCTLVMDRLKGAHFENLAKVAELLEQNTGRLDEFLTRDPQGKHVPSYLAGLARSLQGENTWLLSEVELLRKHIDHVNQIVAMQQNYAKVAGVEESVDVLQLVEDALRINAAALTRHSVELRREFEPVPPILVDKHKVLQILVNLIRNAKYAVGEADRADKVVTVRVRPHNDNIVIQVQDNGIGIPAENLTRIFSHGFTTRRQGHGFGLHSGALAARDLGGTLTAHSDSPGQGATFTLTLPAKRTIREA